jgi:hypothetical protein
MLFLKHSGRMFRAMGYSGPLLIEVSLNSILGIPWLNSMRGGSIVLAGPNSELDDDVAFSILQTSEALTQQTDGIAIDILRRIFFSVNWPALVDTPQNAERLIRNGYDFNFWPLPTNLKI